MRLWSLHPRYLDTRGIVALWREGLLAQAVLAGRTRGYLNHPQLDRFRNHPDAQAAISEYLRMVAGEASLRGYKFDSSRITCWRSAAPISVTRGQLMYEWEHLLRKLSIRDEERGRRIRDLQRPRSHPLFRIVPGDVEPWERVR